MKINYMSDLHLIEAHRDDGMAFLEKVKKSQEELKADVLIIAGDITNACHYHLTELYFKTFADMYKDVVFVCGNHESYGSTPYASKDYIKKAVKHISNFHWLNNSTKTIQGRKFAGGTLWFPEYEDSAEWELRWSDFRAIKLLSPWAYAEHERAKKFLHKEVDNTTIVVTHHLPSFEVVGDKWKMSDTNRFFVGPMDDTIKEKKPELWFFGHTHENRDQKLHDTRFLCNPLGYGNENPHFDIAACVEVADVVSGVVNEGSGDSSKESDSKEA